MNTFQGESPEKTSEPWVQVSVIDQAMFDDATAKKEVNVFKDENTGVCYLLNGYSEDGEKAPVARSQGKIIKGELAFKMIAEVKRLAALLKEEPASQDDDCWIVAQLLGPKEAGRFKRTPPVDRSSIVSISRSQTYRVFEFGKGKNPPRNTGAANVIRGRTAHTIIAILEGKKK